MLYAVGKAEPIHALLDKMAYTPRQTIAAAIEGEHRLVLAHPWLQRGPHRCGDVRGVGHDQGKLAPPWLERLPPAARQQLNLACRNRLLKIAGRHSAGCRRNFDSQAAAAGARTSHPIHKIPTATDPAIEPLVKRVG